MRAPLFFPMKKKRSPAFSVLSFSSSFFFSAALDLSLLLLVSRLRGLQRATPSWIPSAMERVWLLLRVFAGACTLRKSHPSRPVCEEISSRLRGSFFFSLFVTVDGLCAKWALGNGEIRAAYSKRHRKRGNKLFIRY